MSKSSIRHAAPRLDAANIPGITSLMNPQHLKSGVNLDNSEKIVMGKNFTKVKPDNDPVKIYNAELKKLADEIGIDLLDGDVDSDPPPREQPPPKREIPRRETTPSQIYTPPKVTDLVDSIDFNMMDALEPPKPNAHHTRNAHDAHQRDTHRDTHQRSAPPPVDDEEEEDCDCDSQCPDDCDCECHEDCDCDSQCPDDCDCECHEDCDCDSQCPDDCDCECHEEEEGDDDAVEDIISKLEGDLGIDTDKANNRRVRMTDVPHVERRVRENVTDEQERRRHIHSVVNDIRGETRTTFGVERERIQDLKASKLEQIGQLRAAVEDEGFDCTAIGKPTSESEMEEIDSVLNILRLKNDRNRYSSLAEEVILGFAEGIETVFDGSRAVPLVGWRPYYTGYHNTVNIKLHRMRFETSQVVGGIIEKYNIGPTSRIIMELLPSFFLYPRQQRKQRGAPGLSTDPHVGDSRMAMGSIHASDRIALDDLRSM